jgi:uncharacterized protein
MLRMAIFSLVAITSIFVLAGFVKGVIGLGLPTVAMGLLALLMTPAQAAAVLGRAVVPHQHLAGNGARASAARLAAWSLVWQLVLRVRCPRSG